MKGTVRRLRGRALILILALQGGAAWGACSPIVVDVGADGIELGAAGIGVYFDVDNNGRPNHVQWVRPGGDEAFLALDRNGNGVVDSGAELFGVGTPMLLEGTNAPNGFVGLSQYDSRALGGNDDGYITSADAIWPALRLWRDINADGVSTRDEMFLPERLGILSFDTIPRFAKRYDAAGNILPYWAWAAMQGRSKRAVMVDVFFLEL
ncbi:MAG TPA: hypothetical protein VEZ88_11685 [Steroidobacteraceae bacterium]|nr:hypothetical protein [Steroidobacteraceae bacterium]